MKEILIFAGTTEGRELSECLAASGIAHTVCVATEYGEVVLKEHPLMKVHRGRMNREEIKEFIRNGNFEAVVDATHPYADVVTDNIKSAMQETDIPYLRLKRELDVSQTYQGAVYFDTNEACAEALQKHKGNILLTTGSKELSKYCVSEEIKSRLFVRVLPGMESLSLCMEQGIKGNRIIAMQGPFTTEMNEALIHQYNISCMVTKQSGTSGGYPEKLMAAKNTGIPLYVIGHPSEDDGFTFSEVRNELEKLCERKIRKNPQTDTGMQIVLAGAGMGSKDTLTKEVYDAIEDADILLGAQRIIAPYNPKIEKKPFYLAKQIIPYLQEIQEKKILPHNLKAVVLFSGDSGFYSGCQALYEALLEETEKGRLNASVHIMPGISSVAYLASCIGESYQDAAILSMHGKEVYNLAGRIKTEPKTYLLTSGVEDVNRLGKALTEAGLDACEVLVGYQMSGGDKKIEKMTPQECINLTEEGLYTCFIKNPSAVPQKLTHGAADSEFDRDKIPMTKEEVREVSICKLKLHKSAVVYDIGSGTGSIAVEVAGLSDDVMVYAVEQKKEAVALIEQNRKKFGLDNIRVTEAKAPEGLLELPKATHAFIGGSKGGLKEILQTLYNINPAMRVVINAVSLETIAQIKEIPSLYPVENEELVCLQVSRAQKTGAYHLMHAENPVYIFSFNFYEDKK
ncbi:MAG: precorrin-6A reductase [Bacteroides sp.]